jgi:hypothetical protein
MVRALCVAAIAIGLVAGTARADDKTVAEAEAAVAAGDLVKAAGVIDRGLVADPKNLKLLFLRGKVELERRRFASALAAYEAYLAARPRGANKRKAARIVENLAAVKNTFLEVEVTGGAGTVYVDDKSLGIYCVANSVCTVGMMPGRYRLLIEGSGAVPITRDVQVKAGEKATVQVALEVAPTPLTIRVTPADAAVTLDGGALGPGERTVEVSPGAHQLEVSRAGFETVTRQVSVKQGQAAAVDIALPELVRLTNLPAGVAASFELDGKPVSLRGGAVAIPSDGRAHQLAIRADGYRELVVSISAGRDGEPLALDLTRQAPGLRPVDRGGEVGWSGARKGAFIALLAAAGVGITAGSVFGIQAVGKRNDADELCDDQVCTQQGLDLLDDASSRANLSNLGFGVGAAALVGAAVVWLTAPSGGERVAVGAAVTGDGGQISVRIGF